MRPWASLFSTIRRIEALFEESAENSHEFTRIDRPARSPDVAKQVDRHDDAEGHRHRRKSQTGHPQTAPFLIDRDGDLPPKCRNVRGAGPFREAVVEV